MNDLNAFLYRDDKAAGGAGPLAGVTVGVKANIAVKGMPFHAGIGAWASRIAEKDAAVVAALRKAGAAITGILNMEEAALGSKTDNPHFGATVNPHTPRGKGAYSPGGSSGGSGAAVAAGLCDVALGTDTMGSIRIPAAHCGVYGFKPATDRISQDGLEPADPSLDAIGPLARDLETLERVSFVISKMDAGVAHFAGAMLDGHGVTVHPQVADIFGKAVSALAQQPATVRLDHSNSRIRFAGFIEVSKFLAARLAGVETSARLAQLLQYGPQRTVSEWQEDQTILAHTRDQLQAIVEQHGFLIMPTVPNPPFAHSEREPAAQADFTCLANIAGLPALSLPAGWTSDGLPVGVQIVSKPNYEAGLFALARYLDAKLGAYRAPHS